MSRTIKNLRPLPDSAENTANNEDGKVIFTSVQKIPCGFLIREGRLISAAFPSDGKGITGGIYLARVRDVSKELHACFVEISKNTVCYLPENEIRSPFIVSRCGVGSPKQTLHQGDIILVQGIREAQKTKAPTVSCNISISNPYFAISIGNPHTGYSSKLTGEQKSALRELLLHHPMLQHNGNIKPFIELFPEDRNGALLPPVGIVVRTSASKAEPDVLLKKLTELVNEFYTLLTHALYLEAFTCLKEPPQAWEEMLDRLAKPGEYRQVITDDPFLYNEMTGKGIHGLEDGAIRLYTDDRLSLEKLYGLSSKLQDALSTRIWLKSGAYLIIEPTEALTVIDVNSGKCEAHRGDLNYYTKINLEAAREIALQLRLRNISGIILIDFINMKQSYDREYLMRFMQIHMLTDPVKTNVIDITPLGLMELTRQKTYPSLREQAMRSGYPLGGNEAWNFRK